MVAPAEANAVLALNQRWQIDVIREGLTRPQFAAGTPESDYLHQVERQTSHPDFSTWSPGRFIRVINDKPLLVVQPEHANFIRTACEEVIATKGLRGMDLRLTGRKRAAKKLAQTLLDSLGS